MRWMRPWWAFLLGLLVALLSLLPPLLLADDAGDRVADPASIVQYDADFAVGADGSLAVTEQLRVGFPIPRHGIFRFFDIADPSDPRLRHVPQIDEVSLDGRSVPYEVYWEDPQTLVVKIGDPDLLLPVGEYTYVIRYRTDGVLLPPENGSGRFESTAGENPASPQSVFYWNVIAQGWAMPIAQARIDVQLPATAGLVECSVGSSGAGTGPCGITGAGTSELVLTAVNVPPFSGMTTRIGLPVPPATGSALPWPDDLDAIFGRSVPVVVLILLLSLGAATGGYLWARSTRETEPGMPILYEPPPGLGPAQAVAIDRESPGPNALFATLLYLADRGAITMEKTGEKSWALRHAGAAWGALDPVTVAVAQTLGLNRLGGRFDADGSVSAGKDLQQAKKRLDEEVDTWAATGGLRVAVPREIAGRILWWPMLVIGALLSTGLPGPSIWSWPFTAFTMAGCGLQASGVGWRRTDAGRQLWTRAGGFERLLSTPASESRFDFAAHRDQFIAFLRFAVAFGLGDEWAAKFQQATRETPPVPTWYPVGSGFYSGVGFSEFDSSISASVSAYHASQSSSGGGGGGGGFGGGGGGGGGGSW